MTQKVTNQSQGFRRLRNRGAKSFWESETKELARTCASARSLIVNTTFDDASFLTAFDHKDDGKGEGKGKNKGKQDLPVGKGENKGNSKGESGGKGHKEKDSNKRKITVVLGLLQDIYWKTREVGSRLAHATVHSPGQVLPKANWATILNRFRRWCLWSSVGVGPYRDSPDGAIQAALDNVPLKCVIYTRDALPANNCVVQREQHQFHIQNDMNRAADRYKVTLSLSIDCVHHQGSLATLHHQQRSFVGQG